MTYFGSELRRRRQECGLSQAALADAVRISTSYLSKIENGRSAATTQVIQACDDALGAEGALAVLAPCRPTPGSPRVRHTSGMPGPPQLFVGRTDERAVLASVLNPLDSTRLCVISGLAGVGKTALALVAAQAAGSSFPRWLLYVDMRGHTPGVRPVSIGEAAYRLLSQLEVDPARVPVGPDDRVSLVRAMLSDRRVLVVLDNVVAADQVRPLLVTSSGCKLIVTSRNRLAALDEAYHLPLETLPLQDAVAIFRSVARDMRSDDVGAVADIVRRCGTLPLAIRIAAARFATGNWTTERFLKRLSDESTLLPALNDGERDVAAAFRVSLRDLPAEQRRVLQLLAIHPAGAITTEAAEVLVGTAHGVLDEVLDRLHDAHLITRDMDGDVWMHDLVRTFAAHCAPPELDGREREVATSRLIDYALSLAVAADELLEPHRFRPHVDAPASDRCPFNDVEQAHRWLRARWSFLTEITRLAEGDPRCCQLALVLRAFFFRDRLFEPWFTTHHAALNTAVTRGDHLSSAMILNNLGMAHVEQGDLAAALDRHAEARIEFTRAGDYRGELDALSSMAWVRLYQGSPEDAVHGLTAALDRYQRSGRVRNAVIAMRGLALACSELDRHDEAMDYAGEATELAQLPVDTVMGVNCLAWVCFQAGNLDDAERHYQEAARTAEEAGSPYERTRALTGLGNIAARRGDPAEAVKLWDRADEPGILVRPVVVGEGSTRSWLEPLARMAGQSAMLS
ncbi:tetratricopeptide repeat protein [Crossiella sp. NPDC003009]